MVVTYLNNNHILYYTVWLQISVVLNFRILPDFRDSLVFRDFEVSSAVLEAAVKKIL